MDALPLHRDAPLHTLPDLLLLMIKHRQYVITTEQGRPVFFMSWAWLSQEAEARYLTQCGNSHASVGLEQRRPDVGL